MDNLKSEIKKVAFEKGADIIGIAAANKEAKDVFSNCRSMVVVAVRLLDGIVDNIKNSPVQYTCLHRYAHVFLNDIGFLVARFIESKGYNAMCIFSRGALGLRKDEGFLIRNILRHIMGYGIIDRMVEKHFKESISFMIAAQEAGLGRIGNCGLLITKQYGVRVELGVILTDCPLEADEKITKNYCLPEKCTFSCVTSCPAKAISKNGLVNRVRCYKHILSCKQKGIRELECGICVASCPAQIEWRQ